MTEPTTHSPVATTTRPSRARRHGWPGIATIFVSLTALAVHHFWWVRVRMMTDFDPGWGPTDRDLTGARESITATTITVTVVATVLVVAAPVLVWVWRRSPVWPPLAATGRDGPGGRGHVGVERLGARDHEFALVGGWTRN